MQCLQELSRVKHKDKAAAADQQYCVLFMLAVCKTCTASLLFGICRMYLHHVRRAQGRTISFHHISKCGGTTMCQLAATNRCSNPHLTIEKNCVMDDRCAQQAV
jgi:hypothetical protein